jgi:hypothetical protein
VNAADNEATATHSRQGEVLRDPGSGVLYVLLGSRLVPFTVPTVTDAELRQVHEALTAACVMASRRARGEQ